MAESSAESLRRNIGKRFERPVERDRPRSRSASRGENHVPERWTLVRGEQGEAPFLAASALHIAPIMKKKTGHSSKAKVASDEKRSVSEKIAMTAGALLLILFTVIGMEFTLHGSHISHLQGVGSAAPPVGDPLFTRTMEMFTGTHLTDGNHVTVLLNGEQTYPAIWKELRGAKADDHDSNVLLRAGEDRRHAVGDSPGASTRRRESVHLLTDAFGAQNITKGYFDTLRAAGVHTAKFRPVHWYEMQKLQNRSHIARSWSTGAWDSPAASA